jgi:cobyrinic acid a,c-diamide synthase
MGIFDGLGGTSPRASSYDLASVTDTPVILIVNARGMSLSVIAMIQGYLDYQKKLGSEVIRGVILNQTTRMTYLMLKEQIERETGIRLFGYVPMLRDCTIESRHLGLVTPDEITGLHQTLQRLSEELETCLDMEGILALAQEAPDYREEELQIPETVAGYLRKAAPQKAGENTSGGLHGKTKNFADRAQAHHPRIGVARDEAFCFYYQDNLDLLEMLGAELVSFSPLHDAHLPEQLHGMIFGGGYPELYAEALAANISMKHEIREALAGGMPYLAECGGFMYLHEEMEDMNGRAHPMCGVIAGKSYRTSKLSRFGYVELTAKETAGSQLLISGQTIRAHEFHYFDSTNAGTDYHAQKPTGKRNWDCIHGDDHSAAGYPHLYYWSNPGFAAEFLHQAESYAENQKRTAFIQNPTEFHFELLPEK